MYFKISIPPSSSDSTIHGIEKMDESSTRLPEQSKCNWKIYDVHENDRKVWMVEK